MPGDRHAGSKETDMSAPTSVESYLAALPAESRAVLQELRETIMAAAPEATETISYQIPTFKVRGRMLVSCAAFKDHYSLYPASLAVVRALGEELKPHLTRKATIRFPAGRPIPSGLVTRVVMARLEEIRPATR
jgi:uncharacterized protein YdhG (YjbR/CyaY superfamily)